MQIRANHTLINLTKNDFLAAGGQGQVYVKNGIAYKIYTDPSTMIPIQKINELSTLTHPNIIKPEYPIYGSGHDPIGYTMKFIKNAIPLCQLFTKAYKERNGLDPKDIFDLIKKLQKIVAHAHENDILIVDLNEMNFLCLDKKYNDIYAIDVDSWQTKSFPAQVIMDSIKDRHAKKFDENTDWFSFGIVTFQLMIGIHPYKGKHPKVKTLDDRMLHNISVFNQEVSVPPVCYDFNIIPKNYLNWYQDIFEKGKRLPPPLDSDVIQAVVAIKKIIANGDFIIKSIFTTKENIVQVDYIGNNEIIITKNETFFNQKEAFHCKTPILISQTNRGNPVGVYVKNEQLIAHFIVSGKEIPVPNINVESIMSYNGIIYAKNDNNILELTFNEIGNNVMVLTKIVSTVLQNTSLKYEGCIIQDMIGSKILTVFPKLGTSYQINLKELNNHQILNAKFDSGVLMTFSICKSKYYKFIYRFNDDYSEYDVSYVEDIGIIPINFIVLDSGIVCHINENDEVELFNKKYNSKNKKVIQTNQVDISKILIKGPSGVQFISDTNLYGIRMK